MCGGEIVWQNCTSDIGTNLGARNNKGSNNVMKRNSRGTVNDSFKLEELMRNLLNKEHGLKTQVDTLESRCEYWPQRGAEDTHFSGVIQK